MLGEDHLAHRQKLPEVDGLIELATFDELFDQWRLSVTLSDVLETFAHVARRMDHRAEVDPDSGVFLRWFDDVRARRRLAWRRVASRRRQAARKQQAFDQDLVAADRHSHRIA